MTGHRESMAQPAAVPPPPPPPVSPYPEAAEITSLGLARDAEARGLLRRALRDAWPAARRFVWRVSSVCELEANDEDVGYTGEDGTIFVKVRDPTAAQPSRASTAPLAGSHGGGKRGFYPYSFVLATLLHELSHLSHLGHGRAFYRRLVDAASECGTDPYLRREVRGHICAELINAVCDNDARRARALLEVLPEAVACRLPGPGRQLPLEYAAHHGRVALTKLLLEARADANAGSEDAIPPLARAAAQGNTKTARLLLEAGAVRGRERATEALGHKASLKPLLAEAYEGSPQCGAGEGGGYACRCVGARRMPRQGRRPARGEPSLRRAGSLPALLLPPVAAQHLPSAKATSDKSPLRSLTLAGSLAL